VWYPPFSFNKNCILGNVLWPWYQMYPWHYLIWIMPTARIQIWEVYYLGIHLDTSHAQEWRDYTQLVDLHYLIQINLVYFGSRRTWLCCIFQNICRYCHLDFTFLHACSILSYSQIHIHIHTSFNCGQLLHNNKNNLVPLKIIWYH
jgi:hypothetical protein